MNELIHGAGAVCIYFAVAASTMLALRWLIHIPDELFRKILHFILLFFYLPFALAPDSQAAVWLDFVGSIIVAVYLTWCGIQTVWEAAGKPSFINHKENL